MWQRQTTSESFHGFKFRLQLFILLIIVHITQLFNVLGKFIKFAA